MKRSIKQTIGFPIETMNGPNGQVQDVLFDENRWVIRYVEVEPSLFSSGKRIIIPRQFIKGPENNAIAFKVWLTQEQLEKCPSIEADLPVSRKYEEELAGHYNSTEYWHYTTAPGAIPGITFPPRPVEVPDKLPDEKALGTTLRSFKELQGYDIKALDGQIGHLEDCIVDFWDSQIIYLVVDTSNWVPWSKRVLLEIGHLRSVSYIKREISVDLTQEAIKNAPEFDPSTAINEQYERKLYDYYGRKVV